MTTTQQTTEKVAFGSITIGNKTWTLSAYAELSAAQGRIATKAIGAWLRAGNASLYDGASHTIAVWVTDSGFAVVDSWHWDWAGNEIMGDLE